MSLLPSYRKGSQSGRSQKHSSSILPLHQKYKVNQKKQEKRVHLSPQQKTMILQNASLIFQFIRDKLQIVTQISLIDSELTVENFVSEQFKCRIGEIYQIVDFVQRNCLRKLQHETEQNTTQSDLNELIYSSLLEINEISSKLKERISELKRTSFSSKRADNPPTISSSINESPETNQNSRTSKRQHSTSHLSRVNAQEFPKVNSFKNLITVQDNYILNSEESNESIIQDSLDSDCQQQTVTEEHRQKLKNYFYTFIISLSATDTQFHSFLDSLYDELAFDNQFSVQKVQKSMMEDDQYCMRILVIALTNKFQKMIKFSKFTNPPEVSYFPNQAEFLALTLRFVLTNTQQMTDKIDYFCKKVRQVSEVIQTTNQIANEVEREQNLKNTLSRYLPQNGQNYSKQTSFSKNLQILKQDMLKKCKLKNQFQPLYVNFIIFEKIILKICFDRVSTCKRHNFEAAENIFQVLKNSTGLKTILHEGLSHIYEFSEKSKEFQRRQQQVQRIFNSKLLKKLLMGWKSIRERKERILKLLVRKKIKLQKKERTLIFNRWRINISRQRIEQKMMIHSSSCAAIINKFTEDQIESFEQKKNKINESREKSIHLMSGVTMKRTNSYKNSVSNSRGSNNSKTKIAHISQKYSNNEDLRLLNYQYKQEILDKLKRQNNRDTQNKPRQISNKITRKTLLKV